MTRFTLAILLAGAALAQAPAHADDKSDAALYARVDAIFADYALDQHVPGLVVGIVADGKLAYVRGMGVQDLQSKRPVTPDSLFRIASMTKAFTALTVLKLRDDGLLQLDAPAETYVPELKNWKYPTQDSPRSRVRDRKRRSRSCCAAASRSATRPASRWNTPTWATRCWAASSATSPATRSPTPSPPR
jgi:CubicO group peptidase (beta-lactamase class C family)